MEKRKDGTVHLSRNELYDLVWSRAVSSLAREFGLSDVGLAKICRKHNIPRPPLGYWARVQAGQRVERTPLPRLSARMVDKLVIKCREPKAEPLVDEAFAQMLSSATLEQLVPIAAGEPLHPLVELTKTSLLASRPDSQGLLEPRSTKSLRLSVGPDSVDRALGMLDAIARWCDANSAVIGPSGEMHKNLNAITIRDQCIEIQLHETLNHRIEKPPAPVRIFKGRPEPLWPQPNTVISSPSGNLVLLITTHTTNGARRRWVDSESRKLETHLPAFVTAVVRAANDEEQSEKRRQAEELRREQVERKRKRMVRQIADEEARVKTLLSQVDAWHESKRIDAFVAHVRANALQAGSDIGASTELGAWLQWASDQAKRRDPLRETPRSILDEKPNWERRPSDDWWLSGAGAGDDGDNDAEGIHGQDEDVNELD